MRSRDAMWMGWGPEFYFFCNDACALMLGLQLESALPLSARKVLAEIWSDIGPRAESVVLSGEATCSESLLLFLERSGYREETYHTFSYSPLPDDDSSVGGTLCVVRSGLPRPHCRLHSAGTERDNCFFDRRFRTVILRWMTEESSGVIRAARRPY
jgi:hypothetical protein